MADILTPSEIDALLATVGAYDYSPYDIYINKESNKKYYLLQEILNKTDGTLMIMYAEVHNNLRMYVREKEDFFNKFIKVGE